MNEFDLKDYLKDNKLLQEEKKPLVNEEPITGILAAVAAKIGGIPLTIIGTLVYLGIIGRVNKFLREKYGFTTSEVVSLIAGYISSRIGSSKLGIGTKSFKERDKQKDTVFKDIQDVYKKLDKNYYTRNEGENLIQISKNLKLRFFKLDTRDYEKMIKLLEEALVLAENAYTLADKVAAGKIDVSVGDDGRPEDLPTATLLMLLENLIKLQDLRDKVEEALAEVHNKFKAYKSAIATKSPNAKK